MVLSLVGAVQKDAHVSETGILLGSLSSAKILSLETDLSSLITFSAIVFSMRKIS